MKIINIITTILAIFISILFVAVLLTSVLSSAVIATITTKGAVQIIEKIDYQIIKPEKKQVLSVINDLPLDAETKQFVVETVEENENVIDEVLQSTMAKQLLGSYADDLIANIKGEKYAANFTNKNIRKIIDENSEEIAAIIKEEAGLQLSDKELTKIVKKTLNDNINIIVKEVPSVQQIKLPDTTQVSILSKAIFGPYFAISLYVLAFVLGILIFLCTIENFGGFLYLGLDFLISAIITLLFGAISKQIINYLTSLNQSKNILLGAVFSVATSKLFNSIVILFGVGTLFIIFYIVLKKYSKKKSLANQETLNV